MARNDEKATVEVILKGQSANATLKDLRASARALSADLARLPKNSDEFVRKSDEFKKVNARIKSMNDEIRGTGGVFEGLGKQLKAFSLIAIAAFGFQWITGQFKNIIQGNADLSDSLADVRKTTGMTEQEARKLNTALSQMNTRTATKELRQIAIGAGQLGVAKQDVLKFTAAMDKMNVALGDEFTGGAEQLTKEIGGLRDIFSDIKSDKIDTDLLNIGNAINVLASEGRATGPVVADFSNRIAGVGIPLGLASGQVLGLSATLQELNVNTERGGTAITRILLKMTQNTADFAKVAGMEVQEFTDLVNKDLFGAFMKVVEGSKKSGTSATEFAKILDGLGVDGAGASEVFSKLGSNTTLLKQKVDLATQSLKNTDSIMAEFAIKNNTLGAEMDRLGKSINSTFVSSGFSNVLKSIIGGLADFFDKTKKVSDGMRDEQIQINALVFELKNSNTENKRKKEIYEELKSINPDIVKGINQESISLETLTKNLKKYNDETVNKIIIQKQDEKINDVNQKLAEKMREKLDLEAQISSLATKLTLSENGQSSNIKKILDDETKPIEEKIKHLNELLKNFRLTANNQTFTEGQIMMIEQLQTLTHKHANSTFYANKAYLQSIGLLSEKDKLLKQLGISLAENTTKQIENNEVIKTASKERIGLIKQLQDDISALNEKRINASTVSEIRSYDKQIAAKQAQLDVLLGKETDYARKMRELHEQLSKEIKALESENNTTDMGDYQKQAFEILAKHAETEKRISEDKKLSSEQREEALFILRKNSSNKIKKLDRQENAKLEQLKKEHNNSVKKLLQTAQENEIDAVHDKYDKLIASELTNKDTAKELTEEREREIAEIKQKYRDKDYQEKVAHEKKLQDEILKAQQDEIARRQKDINTVMHYYDQASQLGSMYMNNQRMAADNEQQLKNQQFEDAFKREQRMLDKKLISQAEYDKRVALLESKQRDSQKMYRQKQAQAEKQAAIINTIILGAEAIARIWAVHGVNPAQAIPLSIISGGITAAKVALISAQPMPQFAKGGFSEPNGFVNNETIFKSSTGKPFIAGEAGSEWIAPNWMLQNPITANTIQMLEAVRQNGRVFAKGGITANESDKYDEGIGRRLKSNFNSGVDQYEALNKMVALLADIRDNGIDARINYDEYTKTMNGINQARNRAAY